MCHHMMSNLAERERRTRCSRCFSSLDNSMSWQRNERPGGIIKKNGRALPTERGDHALSKPSNGPSGQGKHEHGEAFPEEGLVHS